MFRRLLQRIARFGFRAPYLVVPLVAIGAAWSFLQLGRYGGPPPPERLLPAGEPVAGVADTAERLFASGDYLTIVLEAREPSQHFQLKALAEVLAGAVADRRFIGSLVYKLEAHPLARQLGESFPGIVNYFAGVDLEAMASRLSAANIDRAVTSLRSASPLVSGPTVAAEGPGRDPLGFFAVVRNRLLGAATPSGMASRDGYFFAANGRVLALFARPNRPPSDAAFCRALMDFLEETRAALEREDDISRDIAISFVGPHIRAAAQSRVARRDLARAFFVALGLIAALIVFAYRRAIVLASVLLPMLASVALSLALAGWIFGYLGAESLAVALTAGLVALAAGIALHDRYIEEALAEPDRLGMALRRASEGSGRINFTAAALVSVIFVQLLSSDLPDVPRLALALVGAVALSCLVAQWATPAVLRLLAVPSRRRSVSEHFSTFGMRHLAWGALAYPRAWLGLVVIASSYLTFHAVRIELPAPAAPVSWVPEDLRLVEDRVARQFPVAQNHARILLEGDELEPLLQRNDALNDLLRERAEQDGILAVHSLQALLPSLERQREARLWLLQRPETNDELLRRRLKESALAAGMKDDVLFGPFLTALDAAKSYAAERPYVRWGDIRDSGVNSAIRERLTLDGERYLIATDIYATEEAWGERGMPTGLTATIRRHFPDAQIAEPRSLAAARRFQVVRLLILGGAAGLMALAAGLLLAVRSKRRAAVALLVLLLPGLWAMGAVRFGDFDLPTWAPLLAPGFLALGVANVLHMLLRLEEQMQRIAEEAAASGESAATGAAEGAKASGLGRALYRTINSAGRPVAVSYVATTLISVGLLMADHRDIGAIGLLVLVVGLGQLLATLAVMPCILLLTDEGRPRLERFLAPDDPRPFLDLKDSVAAAKAGAKLAAPEPGHTA